MRRIDLSGRRMVSLEEFTEAIAPISIQVNAHAQRKQEQDQL